MLIKKLTILLSRRKTLYLVGKCPIFRYFIHSSGGTIIHSLITDASKTHLVVTDKQLEYYDFQVAELMAVMAKNRSLSYCKVVEVIAETTAPLTPMEELLAKIPSQRAEPNVGCSFPYQLYFRGSFFRYIWSIYWEAFDALQVSVAAEVPVSSPSSIVTSEPPIVPTIEEESREAKLTTPRPLSPYAA